MSAINNHLVTEHNIAAQSDGDFLVVKPSASAWKAIARIQGFVNQQLCKAGITTFVATPFARGHLTLFKGFNGQMTSTERKALMVRVARKTAGIANCSLNFDVKNAKVKLGPKVWVTLQFDSEQADRLHAKVKEAIKEALAAGELRPEIIDMKDLSKPDGNFRPHLSLGILDLAEGEQHPDLAKLNSGDFKRPFGKLAAEKMRTGFFSELSFNSPVREVTLLGVDDMKAKAKDKRYTEIAASTLGR